MKFDAAATTPGCANSVQYGTEPSAKSIQAGAFFGSAQGSAVAAAGAPGRADAVTPATASNSTRRETRFTRATLSSRKEGGRLVPPACFTYCLRLVERRVDLGHLFGLFRRVRRVLLAEAGSAAEVEAEVGEARAVAAVAADLLERRQERLALVRGGVRAVGSADVDRAVPLEAGRRRDQLADDHVLLQPEQPVDLAFDRCVRQHLRRLLERGGGEEGLRRERRLRDSENQRLERRLPALLLLPAPVLAIPHGLARELARPRTGGPR